LQPSILILYTGHNDFVFYPMIENVLATSNTQLFLRKWGDNSALWRILRRGIIPHSVIPKPVETPSFDRQAKAAFNQLPLSVSESSEMRSVLLAEQELALVNIKAFYQENVTAIVKEAKDRGVNVLLVVPVSRLDSPPVDGVHWKEMSDQDLTDWNVLWSQLQEQKPGWSDPRWQQLLQLDNTYSPATHEAAKQAWIAGEKQQAKHLWRLAQERTPPSRTIRMPEYFGDLIIETADVLDVPVLDLRPIWKAVAKEKDLPAGDLFLDALHFNERSTALLSELIFHRCKESGWLEGGAYE
jgi:hypothetical protein